LTVGGLNSGAGPKGGGPLRARLFKKNLGKGIKKGGRPKTEASETCTQNQLGLGFGAVSLSPGNPPGGGFGPALGRFLGCFFLKKISRWGGGGGPPGAPTKTIMGGHNCRRRGGGGGVLGWGRGRPFLLTKPSLSKRAEKQKNGRFKWGWVQHKNKKMSRLAADPPPNFSQDPKKPNPTTNQKKKKKTPPPKNQIFCCC